MAEQTTKRGKSRYAKKIVRKLGRGRVNPNWMWCAERSAERQPPVVVRTGP
jgi:hypothetical protein